MAINTPEQKPAIPGPLHRNSLGLTKEKPDLCPGASFFLLHVPHPPCPPDSGSDLRKMWAQCKGSNFSDLPSVDNGGLFGLNLTPPNPYVKSPVTSQCDCSGERAFRELIKVKGGHQDQPDLWDLCPYKKRERHGDTQAQSEGW